MALVIRRSLVSAVLAPSVESTTRCLELLEETVCITFSLEISGGEELNQDGSKGFRLDHVGLPCQGAIVRIGQCLC
jgi:hypothetical protein